jgi:hypothetical protein
MPTFTLIFPDHKQEKFIHPRSVTYVVVAREPDDSKLGDGRGWMRWGAVYGSREYADKAAALLKHQGKRYGHSGLVSVKVVECVPGENVVPGEAVVRKYPRISFYRKILRPLSPCFVCRKIGADLRIDIQFSSNKPGDKFIIHSSCLAGLKRMFQIR